MDTPSASTPPDPASATADETAAWVRACLSVRAGDGGDAQTTRVARTLMRLFPALAMAKALPGDTAETFAAELSALSHG